MSPQDPLLLFLMQSRIAFLIFFLMLTVHYLQEASPYTPHFSVVFESSYYLASDSTAMQQSSFLGQCCLWGTHGFRSLCWTGGFSTASPPLR